MHGKIRIGYSSGSMKCFPPLDGGWTNAHGSETRSRLRRRLRQKVLAKKDAGVVGQGAVKVEDKNGQGGGDNGVAA